jgi:hypothetical protein
MMFIAAIWLGALIWALISGRAFVLRYVSRADEPIRYWLAVGVYGIMFAVFASLGPVR